MSKRIVLIHGWNDQPDSGWMAWLRAQTQALGYEYVAPQMPVQKLPVISRWVSAAQEAIGTLKDNPILIGHSLGTYILLNYLAEYDGPTNESAHALILVAGFLKPGSKRADHFFRPIKNIANVSRRSQRIYNIYSDNDKLVLPSRSMQLAKTIGDESLYMYNCISTLDTTAFNSIQQFIGISRDRYKCRRQGTRAVKAYLRNRPDFLELRPHICTLKRAPIRTSYGSIPAVRV